MKISLDWLSDFVELKTKDPQAIASALTCAMGEVDDIAMPGALLGGCVVGKVLSLQKHPNADKLAICEVETKNGTKRVVCGGTNLREGMQVAFAPVGATVKWHGNEMMTLQKVKIRGEESEGMICAAEELGLETMFPPSASDGTSPIIDLTPCGLKTGQDLRSALGLSDAVFHIDNHAITNRADLFSHLGVARECVALGLGSWKKRPKQAAIRFPKTKPPFRTINDARTLVPRYHACLLTLPDLGSTPDWMKRRLEAVGLRSINLPIDITNYVMMELGMPLHSFDADDFSGDIHIRLSKAGEAMTTLDGAKRELPEGILVMSDREGIFDLFGIMGGERSSTKDSTRRIYLQAAIMDPAPIRKAILSLAHRTDAATIYEKGVPFSLSRMGLERAIELFLTLCPGAQLSSAPVEWGKDPKPKAIALSYEKLHRMIGEEVKPARAKTILSALGFAARATSKGVAATPPIWRGDISIPADLVEEVARVRGYNDIPARMPAADISPPARDFRLHQVREALKEQAFVEMLHLAFVSPALARLSGWDAGKLVKIENPIGEELSLMRPGLLPALLATAGKQLRESDADLKCYEAGHVFLSGSESTELCALIAKKNTSTLRDEPLLMLKADLRYAANEAGYSLQFKPTEGATEPQAHPGRSMDILCGGEKVGSLFEVHPAMCEAFGLHERVVAAIIDWDRLMTLEPLVKIAKPLPAYPAIIYDETLSLAAHANFAELLSSLRAADPLLTSIELADLYDAGGVKTMTLRFTYRSSKRTLTQEETDVVHRRVLAKFRATV